MYICTDMHSVQYTLSTVRTTVIHMMYIVQCTLYIVRHMNDCCPSCTQNGILALKTIFLIPTDFIDSFAKSATFVFHMTCSV